MLRGNVSRSNYSTPPFLPAPPSPPHPISLTPPSSSRGGSRVTQQGVGGDGGRGSGQEASSQVHSTGLTAPPFLCLASPRLLSPAASLFVRHYLCHPLYCCSLFGLSILPPLLCTHNIHTYANTHVLDPYLLFPEASRTPPPACNLSRTNCKAL